MNGYDASQQVPQQVPQQEKQPLGPEEAAAAVANLTEEGLQNLRQALNSVAQSPQPMSEGTTQYGGKRKGRRATKKGGDMGAGLLTAGTLLLLQAAAKSLLAKNQSQNQSQRGGARKTSKKQRGGEVIQSVPAPFGGDGSLVQSTLAGGSMCGASAQMGGKRKTQSKSRKQKGGALDVSGELGQAFGASLTGQAGIAEQQAGIAMTQVSPFTITGSVSQEGGKRKTRSRKQQKGGVNPLLMAPLDEAFAQTTVAGAVPINSPLTNTALHPQTGGKRKSKSKTSRK